MDFQFQYGAPGWIPIVGDWNGTGHTGVGVVDPVSMTWYLRNEVSPGAPTAGQFAYGVPGWKPVVGDWDGNGTFTIGLFNPGPATWYLRDNNSAGAPDAGKFDYGFFSWAPVAGAWGTGGATATPASARGISASADLSAVVGGGEGSRVFPMLTGSESLLTALLEEAEQHGQPSREGEQGTGEVRSEQRGTEAVDAIFSAGV